MAIQPKVLDEVMPWKFDPKSRVYIQWTVEGDKVILTRAKEEKPSK